MHAFAQNKAYHYKYNLLAKIWAIINEKQEMVGFFTTSMTSIETKIMPSEEQVNEINTKYYPAMLLGQMGVDKKYRGQKIGRTITHFCTGLALDITKKVACRYLVLQTDADHLDFYQKYCSFIPVKKTENKKLIMMYRRLY